ncbi:DUF4236 domain-containing protein [Asticcacaulis sp.]|uniref:DUF4236 domain-containing protein n=1 Tax=Asticcacaulis sp. TaxID=1872648 RepID=UPI002BBDCE23|nr:DUF4236 domain-containing protein [Asticcacaulis sp.]HTM80765.1 DUF4236 domain-containing protein [Asticcacaulis sp.]
MPFYFRKSVSAGPFRFNFSKGGVGVSVGVKGFRIGTGPRGHYVHAGRGGLYYRATVGKAGARKTSQSPFQPSPVPQRFGDTNSFMMIEVESADVMGMRDESFSDLLDEINKKSGQAKLSTLLGWGIGLLGFLISAMTPYVDFWLCLFALPGWGFGKWMDSYRRTTVLFYEIDEDFERRYQAITSNFDKLCECAGKWHMEAGGAVTDLTTWKRNAGASHLVQKKPTILAYKLPPIITSNVTPPAFHVGRQIMYFLPDVVLMQDGVKMGAISYSDLHIRWQDSNFIEEGPVPRDAVVIGHTWKHPNKSGGPDRRFRDNHQIPICRYEVMHFTSSSGVNELVEFSRTGVTAGFSTAIGNMLKNPNAIGYGKD